MRRNFLHKCNKNHNIDKIKLELLQETNYRCGYCIRNITPRVYFLDHDPKTPIYDYVFYNIFERCHIEANCEVNDKFKNFYNLIAMCRICHHDIDKATMLNKVELKRLKLHWMIASGRFTKMEIDILMALYTSFLSKKPVYNYIYKIEEISDDFKNIYFFSTPIRQGYLFKNIINSMTHTTSISGAYQGNSFTAGSNRSIEDTYFIFLNEPGFQFCEQFADIY